MSSPQSPDPGESRVSTNSVTNVGRVFGPTGGERLIPTLLFVFFSYLTILQYPIAPRWITGAVALFAAVRMRLAWNRIRITANGFLLNSPFRRRIGLRREDILEIRDRRARGALEILHAGGRFRLSRGVPDYPELLRLLGHVSPRTIEAGMRIPLRAKGLSTPASAWLLLLAFIAFGWHKVPDAAPVWLVFALAILIVGVLSFLYFAPRELLLEERRTRVVCLTRTVDVDRIPGNAHLSVAPGLFDPPGAVWMLTIGPGGSHYPVYELMLPEDVSIFALANWLGATIPGRDKS